MKLNTSQRSDVHSLVMHGAERGHASFMTVTLFNEITLQKRVVHYSEVLFKRWQL